MLRQDWLICLLSCRFLPPHPPPTHVLKIYLKEMGYRKTILKESQVETAVGFILFWQCRKVTKNRKAYGRKKIYKRHKPSKYPKYTLKIKTLNVQTISSDKQSVHDMCSPLLFALWESQLAHISHSVSKCSGAPPLSLHCARHQGYNGNYLRGFHSSRKGTR